LKRDWSISQARAAYKMKIMVISDVHGNLPALEAVIKNDAADGYINLGDVVNYGPWSNECVDLVSGLNHCINIEGNHERYFAAGECNVRLPIVNTFFKESFKGFDRQELISNYAKETSFMGFYCTHTIESKYIFHDTEVQLNENTMIGHSHQQYLREQNGFKLLNPGSVGQNRKYINLANYAMWDTDKNTFELKFLKYNVDLILSEMKARHYPPECIDYYHDKDRY
jgi:putative phosphoesterase